MTAVAVLIGNPRPRSRTLDLALRLPPLLLPGRAYDLTVIDLAEHAGRIFDSPSPELDALTDAVAKSDLAIIGSPTYKASYTGLLKAFLDRYANDGLAGVTAVPFLTGGDLRHYLAVETHLRPLLTELGASTPTAGLYFPMAELDRANHVLTAWADANAPLVRLEPAHIDWRRTSTTSPQTNRGRWTNSSAAAVD